MYKICCILFIISQFFAGCDVLKPSSAKYNFADGYYYSRLNGEKNKRYYVVTGGDSIKVYPATIQNVIADTSKMVLVLFPPHARPQQFKSYLFKKETFDADVLTILFKYRFPLKSFPGQLNSTFNGAGFFGYRTDIYRLSYNQTPLHIQDRNINHFGYSIGGFIGVGAARIDEYVTLNRINYEYDGCVLTGGVAGVFAMDKVNFGINSGIDCLTDRNKNRWVNQKKLWIGVSVGLNLN